ncbi:MAG: hypothetical protein OZSIB_1707 [Candidatus Ozemobacter sibiricus]|jgi:type III restriction enzyme|uniref:Uncharacterized protein n=1 Tax=Candidatus Ozemobacter sibiricus TaxID=2268124 RepID=A0A367ZLE1_9BACT|nr:MAG: hypothetical protein OZSIB_1707 [Candidatus Ozemobacter sibiricus]
MLRSTMVRLINLHQRDLKDSAEQATIWIGGLDRLTRVRGL